MKNLFIFLLCCISNQVSATLVYSPVTFKPQSSRVLVVLHGCLQSAESMAMGAGFNQIADRENLLVIYPQVPSQSHPMDCWSWYEANNQRVDQGQLQEIVTEVRRVKAQYSVPAKADVYTIGISSGGATVAGLLACFPAEFKGGAIHSGPSYALAQDLKTAEHVLKNGPATRPTLGPCRPSDFKGKLIVVQGLVDTVVHPSHSARIIQDFIGTKSAESTQPGRENGLQFTVRDYLGESGARGRVIEVQGLSHAWSGFADNLRHKKILGPKGPIPTILPFFSDAGPNATRWIWEYLR